ncbi:hypothetical protein ACVWXN_010171 [Bradyrhizobium sp. i1.4.4]
MKIDNEIVSITTERLDCAHSLLLKATVSPPPVVVLSEIWLGKR